MPTEIGLLSDLDDIIVCEFADYFSGTIVWCHLDALFRMRTMISLTPRTSRSRSLVSLIAAIVALVVANAQEEEDTLHRSFLSIG